MSKPKGPIRVIIMCCRLYEVVETYSKLHLVMEYANGGELFNKLTTEGKMAESEAKAIFIQLLSAVKHLVSLGNWWSY